MANKKNNYKPNYDRYTPNAKTKTANKTNYTGIALIAFAIVAVIIIVALIISNAPTDTTTPVDYDISQMKSTGAIAQVTNMQNSPNGYINKTVKISGKYSGGSYPSINLMDATNCCVAASLEIVLANGQTTPVSDQEITVIGTFATYVENGKTYCHLINTTIV